jgi:large subunit ribosomal protein L17
MRHHIAGRQLNRDNKQRKALFKNLVLSLFERGEIKTTEAKAKSIRGLVDTLIHKAQQGGTVATTRLLASFFGTRGIVHKLVHEIAPAMKDRVSGFTRIVHLENRVGDNSSMVKMELVVKPAAPVVEQKKEVKPVVKPKKAAPSKQVKKEEVK